MKKFSKFREVNEKEIKSFKIKKYNAVIKQSGLTKYIAYIDGDKLDQFTTAKEAEQAIKDFIDLIGR